MPTIQNILSIAELCTVIIDDKVSKKAFFNTPEIEQSRYMLIDRVRKSVAWMYAKDPNYPTLQGCANYLYSLCNYAAQANAIINGGGGGTVLPQGLKSPIKITGLDFVSSTEWEGQNSSGINILPTYTLQVYYNDVQRFLDEGTEWNRTSAGVEITLPDFDALLYPDIIFYIYISL